ncbi:MAG: S8 family peptidase [Chitinophagales bacterium]|nr:S8 family peptidase [Chitinophagales bacterium]
MKNCLLALWVLLFTLETVAQDNTGKAILSPRTKLYLSELPAKGPAEVLPNYVYRKTDDGIYMTAMIKVNAGFNESKLDAIGAKVNTKAGSIWTVMVPIKEIPAFVQLQGITYIELDEPIAMTLDSVRKSTHVDSVHAGIGLQMPYAGDGIIMGIIDKGFDYTHPTLYDTTGTRLRLSKVWEEKKLGTPPTGFNYGNELSDSTAMMVAHSDDRYNSHGIHVAGIAAGSGYGSPTAAPIRYRGMAYESELVFVSINPDSLQWQSTGITDIIDGLNYIYQYADDQGKPAVVNLSWGPPVGPRDGSSLFSQAVDALTGPGKALVLSGGNNGDLKLHLSKTFTVTDTVLKTFPTFNDYLGSDKTWLDVWGEQGKTFCAQVSLYNNGQTATTPMVCIDGQVNKYKLVGLDGDTLLVSITSSPAEFNGKPRIYIGLDNRSADTVLLTLKGNEGSLHLWNGYVYDGRGYYGELENFGYSWATEGNTDYTTSDFVATETAISVGAYTAKSRFKNINGQNLSLGEPLRKLTSFSSHGPTADGRIKPDITAPGLCVLSSVSSNDTTFLPGGSNYGSVVSSFNFQGSDYYYGQMSGTSMSSPAAAGIVALLLQVNPLLAPIDIRNILSATAIKDTFTQLQPDSMNNLWGSGKINAYQAVILATTYIPNVGIGQLPSSNMDIALYPNPNKGTFVLDVVADNDEAAQISIFDLSGKEIYTDNLRLTAGINHHEYTNVLESKGMFIVRVATSKGTYNLKMAVLD